MNRLPDKTGETRKDVYFKTRQCQWTTAEVRLDFIQTIEISSAKSRVSLGLFRCVSLCCDV